MGCHISGKMIYDNDEFCILRGPQRRTRVAEETSKNRININNENESKMKNFVGPNKLGVCQEPSMIVDRSEYGGVYGNLNFWIH